MIKTSSVLIITFCFIMACGSNFSSIKHAKQISSDTIICDTSVFDLYKYFEESSINRFQYEINRFAEKDAIQKPSDSCILFVGSSSIRKWNDLEIVFSPLPVVNRGFGGSTFPELIYYADELIFSYNPSTILIYEGDNDQYFLKPREILECACYLEELIHSRLPNSKLYFLSVKPSPTRRDKIKNSIETNKYLELLTEAKENTYYINVWDFMFDEYSKIRGDLFLKDSLHLNDKGYEIWYEIISEQLKK